MNTHVEFSKSKTLPFNSRSVEKGFTSKPSDILQLQISDLKIRDIYDQVEHGKTSENAMILVVPELLGKQIRLWI